MALTTNVTDRYSNQHIVNLTNPDVPSATTVDAGRLADAAADVEAYFKIYAAIAYDDTDPRHVAVAVPCVEARLGVMTGKAQWREIFDVCIQRIQQLGAVTGKNKVKGKTTSTLTPAQETPTGSIRRPSFDYNQTFDDFTADPPTGDDSEDRCS